MQTFSGSTYYTVTWASGTWQTRSWLYFLPRAACWKLMHSFSCRSLSKVLGQKSSNILSIICFMLQLASLAEVYVNDAFGTAHRAHASTEGVTAHLSPCVGGFLMQKELDYLMGAVQAPNRPFCAIVGGSKVSTKIGVLEQLLEKCDSLILG